MIHPDHIHTGHLVLLFKSGLTLAGSRSRTTTRVEDGIKRNNRLEDGIKRNNILEEFVSSTRRGGFDDVMRSSQASCFFHCKSALSRHLIMPRTTSADAVSGITALELGPCARHHPTFSQHSFVHAGAPHWST
jgi:hypothetical protein